MPIINQALLYLMVIMKKNPEIPILTVDVAFFSIKDKSLEMLMIRRPKAPYKGDLALPGGYVHCDIDDNLNDTARRIIANKTHIVPDYIEQVETVASNSRDPRGWTATVLFLALVNSTKRTENKQLSKNCQWFTLNSLKNEELAFDHSDLISKVQERLIAKSRYTSIPLFLLSREFTLTEAQKCFEISTQATLEKKSFRRRLLDSGVVEETGKMSQTGKRKAALFCVKETSQIHYFPRMIG